MRQCHERRKKLSAMVIGRVTHTCNLFGGVGDQDSRETLAVPDDHLVIRMIHGGYPPPIHPRLLHPSEYRVRAPRRAPPPSPAGCGGAPIPHKKHRPTL